MALIGKDITFGYSPARYVIQGFSLEVQPGERVYLSAPSGTGKTTLCKILAGYLRPASGQVLCNGNPLPKRGACKVQLIGQHPEKALDPRMRMKDSLLEAGDADEALMDRLGIREEWLNRFPHELSGGELQRFCIARALSTKLEYLIADEISTMLDTVTQKEIWGVILEEATSRNLGLLFTTHSPKLAAKIMTREVTLRS